MFARPCFELRAGQCLPALITTAMVCPAMAAAAQEPVAVRSGSGIAGRVAPCLTPSGPAHSMPRNDFRPVLERPK